MKTPSPDFSDDDIALRAHHIWQQRGHPHGEAEEHWALARKELANEQLETAREETVARPVTAERKLDKGGTS